jgi:hypothetical protein
MCKKFVVEKFPEQFDVSKADQAEMLNKSVKFFKENDTFGMDDFANEVMQAPEMISSFKSYKTEFEVENGFQLTDNFDISSAAVKKFKASAKGGKVVITRENFLITLAPYFFPLYAVFVVLVFWAGDLIWGWTQYRMWFHLMLGAAYSFHITLTWHVLKTEQSDITSQGYLFSAVIIFIGNVMLLLIAIPLLANQNIPEVFRWWYAGTVDAVTWLKTMALSLRP